jgi:hypothetical protein
MDIHQADGLEFLSQPFRGLGVTGRADNAAPELRVSLIAIPARDSGLLNNGAVEMFAIDGGVTLFARRKRPFEECFTQVAEYMRGSSAAWVCVTSDDSGAYDAAHIRTPLP